MKRKNGPLMFQQSCCCRDRSGTMCDSKGDFTTPSRPFPKKE
ncbi:DUF779 domain-containing protein [Massilibacterium senegalense]